MKTVSGISLSRVTCVFVMLVALLVVTDRFAQAAPQIYIGGQNQDVVRYSGDGSGRDELLRSYYAPNYVTVDRTNNRFYWGAARKVMRVAFDGSSFEIVFDDQDGVTGVTGVAVDPVNEFIFWTDYNANSIWRGNLDGSGTPEELYSGLSSPVGIDVDTGNGHLYWAQQGNSRVMRGNISGLGTPTEIVATGGGVTGLVLDTTNGKVYWANFADQTLERSDLDGGNKETLFNAGDGVNASAGMSVDVTNGLLYWVDANGLVYRGNSDGTGALTQLFDVSGTESTTQGVAVTTDGSEVIFTGDQSIFSGPSDGSASASALVDLSNAPFGVTYLALDALAQELYFVDAFPGHGIKKVDLEFEASTRSLLTGTITTLFDFGTDGLTGLSGLAHDTTADLLYWSDTGTQKIQRGNADGSGAAFDLFDNGDGLTAPQDLLLDAEGDLVYWIDTATVGIYRGNADGTGSPTELFNAGDGLTAPRGLALDSASGLLYWGDTTGDQILRAQSDGTGAITVLFEAADGVSSPNAIELDLENDKLYVTDSGTADAVLVGNIDGSGTLSGVVTGLTRPTQLRLLADADSDGIPDGVDQCESDSSKTSPGECGCGVADTDSNSNSIVDCLLNADVKDRLSSLRDLVKSLKWTGTPNKKKNKKRRKAQQETLETIQSLIDEIESTMTSNLNSYQLVDSSKNLEKLLNKAIKKARAAKKTGKSNFRKRKKKSRVTINKLSAALS